MAVYLRRKPRGRGLLLIELIVVLLLLGGVSFVATSVISASFRAQRSAREREEGAHRVDNAVAALRRDVWSSRECRVSESAIQLTQPNGSGVVWTYADGALMRRAADDSVRTWGPLPEVQLGARGAVVTLTLTLPSPAKAEEISFVSQVQLLGGVR